MGGGSQCQCRLSLGCARQRVDTHHHSSIGLRAIESAVPKVPIVFIAEPVAQGFVASIARPGGAVTGFSNLEPALGTKVALQSAQTAAERFSLEVIDAQIRNPAEIELGILRLV
jgi:hypothetical protein